MKDMDGYISSTPELYKVLSAGFTRNYRQYCHSVQPPPDNSNKPEIR